MRYVLQRIKDPIRKQKGRADDPNHDGKYCQKQDVEQFYIKLMKKDEKHLFVSNTRKEGRVQCSGVRAKARGKLRRIANFSVPLQQKHAQIKCAKESA